MKERIWWLLHDTYVGLRVVTLLFAASGVYHTYQFAKSYGFVVGKTDMQVASVDDGAPVFRPTPEEYAGRDR